MAAAIRRRFGVEPELKTGWLGSFRVEVDGEVIFDKRATRGWLGRVGFGRFPRDEEVLAALAARTAEVPHG